MIPTDQRKSLNVSPYRTSLLTLLVKPYQPNRPRPNGKTHHADKQPPVFEQNRLGIAGLPVHAHRTIELTLTDDMRILPEHLEVQEGETIHLKISNAGSMLHEWALGTKALDDHAKLMMKFPTWEHLSPTWFTSPPVKAPIFTRTFNRSGDFGSACPTRGPPFYQVGAEKEPHCSSASAKADITPKKLTK